MAIDLWFKYKNSNKSSIKSKAKIFLYVFIMIALKIFNKPGELENFYKERRLKKLMRDNKIPPELENFYSSRLKNK